MIAVDAMGGDFAPDAIIAGSLGAARSGIAVALVGKKEQLQEALAARNANWQSLPITLIDATEVVEMGEDPVEALRKKPNSSLHTAIKLAQEGTAQAVVSAGNSGALMVGATFILGRSSGVERPAIAGYLPSGGDGVLCVDLGANVQCKPEHLVQFAQLGIDHLAQTKGTLSPRVGLLSNGTEPGKGSPVGKEAYKMLAAMPINFVGNIEPGDIFADRVDLVVCDGFSGNVLLKAAEGMAELASTFFANQLRELPVGSAIEKFKAKTDWARQGGALLLGVNGTVVVAHGKSHADAIEQAIMLAQKSSSGVGTAAIENEAKHKGLTHGDA